MEKNAQIFFMGRCPAGVPLTTAILAEAGTGTLPAAGLAGAAAGVRLPETIRAGAADYRQGIPIPSI